MRSRSVKVKITLWYLLLMASMAGLLLAFMLSISNTVVTQTAMTQLSQTVRSNLDQVQLVDGKLKLGADFPFYQRGVYLLIYSKSEALMAGQVPVSFPAQQPFQNGLIRPVDSQSARYYVLDFWLPMGWDNGVWLRGLLEPPENHQTAQNLLQVAMIAMPMFILLAALGGYWIVKRAFRPLDRITATAAAINQATDLSARINISSGTSEFTKLADTFDQMFERLERSFEAEKQFVSNASHELRTPVSVIKGACEYAEKYDDTQEERRETIAMIHRQATRMSALITQLLSMTRLDQGTECAQLELVELTGLVRSLYREWPYGAERITLELEESVQARVDAALLARLLQNLVDNAFKYGKPGGRVWISLRRREGEIRLSVRDDGIGIARDQQDKIWQRFYQVDPSRTGDSGTGLGLAMVWQIAQAHGGSMSVESVPEVGSCFSLHLPES